MAVMRDAVKQRELRLYEEVLLLALRDREGTFMEGYVETLTAGALLAELLLEQRVRAKHLLDVINPAPLGDALLDECLTKVREASRRATLQTWVTRFSRIRQLKHRVAQQLCERGIVKAEKGRLLLLFSRDIYPEIDPVPEQQIMERLRHAIFTDQHPVDARTAVLIALIHHTGLLAKLFGRKELKLHRKRIERISSGHVAADAVQSVVAATNTAIVIAIMVPVIIT